MIKRRTYDDLSNVCEPVNENMSQKQGIDDIISSSLDNLKVVLMAGGRGVRLRPLTYDIPKPMVSLNGKPVLQYGIEWARSHGVKDIIICTGYLSKVIEDYFGDGSNFGVNINYSVEEKPLDTAGPLKQAAELIGDSDFVLLHGDVLCKVDLNKLYKFHKEKNALATIVVHPSSHPEDSDLLELNEQDEVIKFWNKPHLNGMPAENLGNAGLQLFSPEILKYIPNTRYSLEKELLPFLVRNQLAIYGYKTDEFLLDLGNPNRLKNIEQKIKDHGSENLR